MTRVISLLPAATEIVCALGARDDLCGVSHQCDWPPSIHGLPRVTRTALVPSGDAAAIDTEVRTLVGAGAPLYELCEEDIAALRPDVILTQALCRVCAVSERDVRTLAARLDPAPRVVAVAGATLDGVLADLAFVGGALGRTDAAQRLLDDVRQRMRLVHETLKAARAPRPRVAVIEWIDPPYAAGHWVPDVVHRAGGVDVLAQAGDLSRVVRAADVEAARPDLVIVAPCGLGLDDASSAARKLASHPEWSWARAVPLWALDGNALLSRGGPRLIEGIEALAKMMHPGLFGAPPHVHARQLELDEACAGSPASSSFDRPALAVMPALLSDG
jgi:iron complex transport system substrate-binding protein